MADAQVYLAQQGDAAHVPLRSGGPGVAGENLFYFNPNSDATLKALTRMLTPERMAGGEQAAC